MLRRVSRFAWLLWCVALSGTLACGRAGDDAPPPAGGGAFYSGAPGTGTLVGKQVTKGILYPAQSEVVTLDLASPSATLLEGTTPFHVRVNDTLEPHPAWTACRMDNNTSQSFSGSCGKD